MVSVLTPGEYSIENFKCNPLKEHFLFQVKACHHAHVTFSSDMQFFMNHELVIGYDYNTHTILRDKNDENVVVEATPGILDCYRNREFWVTWSDGTFRFGKGHLFEQMVIDYQIPDYHPFTAVSLATSGDSLGEFNFDYEQGKSTISRLQISNGSDFFSKIVRLSSSNDGNQHPRL